MAVRIRLRREGKKKAPFYRIVVADSRSPRDGRYIEDLGFYQPLHDPSTIKIEAPRALYWLRQGAQPSAQVKQLLRIEGIWEEFKPGDTGRDRSAKIAARRAADEARDKKIAEAEEEAAKAVAAKLAEAEAEALAAEEAAAAEAAAEAGEETTENAGDGEETTGEAPAEETAEEASAEESVADTEETPDATEAE